MNNEIKEILEEIDNKIIPNEHWNKIKDYITNLQEELKGIKSNFDIQLEYDKELENKITNLQEENEDLKDRLKVMEHFKNSLQEENERLDTELNAYKDEFCKDTIKKYELVMEQEDYKSRCEKAIDEISKLKPYLPNRIPSWLDELLNILNGGDE